MSKFVSLDNLKRYDTNIKNTIDTHTEIKTVTITTSQVVSISPLELNITADQQEVFENNNYISFIFDATSLGMPVGVIRRNDTDLSGTGSLITFITDAPTFDETVVYGANYYLGLYNKDTKVLIVLSFSTPLKDEVLTKTNTTEYTPTLDYHPATKKYIDDKVTAITEYIDSKSFDATSISGYDATKTQFLKHVNGTLTWVEVSDGDAVSN